MARFLGLLAGKTTVANAVADRLNRKFDDQDSVVAVIPMDGWHIPKDRLLEEFGEEGMKRRGAPWTFDAKKCFQDLKQAKEKKSASLPIYSREISDPVSNGVEINEKHRIIIVEGLYLLWKDDDDWRQVNSLFDEGWFVKCPTREEQINRLVQRSKATWSPDKVARWGPWPEGSIKRAKANDVKNMDLLDPCEQYADEIIFSHYNKA
jgi:pantothenate kinase